MENFNPLEPITIKKKRVHLDEKDKSYSVPVKGNVDGLFINRSYAKRKKKDPIPENVKSNHLPDGVREYWDKILTDAGISLKFT